MSSKLLIISPYIPYDNVPHAGGKTHNYYFKRFSLDNDFEVNLITFSGEEEADKVKEIKKYCNNVSLIVYSNNIVEKIKRGILNLSSKFNIFDKNAGMSSGFLKYKMINELKRLKDEGYNPDYILLEWTTIVLLVDYIKEVFPGAKVIASEHDVSYLGFERKLNINNNFRNRIRYKKIYNSEIEALSKVDLVVTHNFKDYNLLNNLNVKFNKLDYICPYYDDYRNSYISSENKNILFFGAMDREENYESCIWFIKNVFYKLLNIDNEFKLYIVGNKPNEKLLKYKSNEIIITGFVESVQPYFEKSLCMVCPLLLGAGIKVKVLEAMSSGLLVISNDIGIEGVPVIAGKEYIHCETPNEYINAILEVANKEKDPVVIGKNGKEQIINNFSLETSYNKLKRNMLDLIKS